MSTLCSRRDVVCGIAATAATAPTYAWAKYPFCHVLRLASFAPPHMTAWTDAFQAAVRKQIEWPDGLVVVPGTNIGSFPTAVKALVGGDGFHMLLIHASGLLPLGPDFVVLSDPRVARAAMQSNDRIASLLKKLADMGEAAGVTLLSTVWNFDVFGLRSSVPFQQVGDLKGKSFAARGLQNQTFVSAVGAKAVNISADQSFVAVRQGAVEGAILPAYAIQQTRPDDLSAIALNRWLAQGYVMLINRQLLRRVDQAAEAAFANAGREAASVYQKIEADLYQKALSQFKTVYPVSTADAALLEKNIASTLDEQYAKLKVTNETLTILNSLSRA